MTDQIDVIIPVYHPDQKLEALIHRLNGQTRKPDHIWFLQTMSEPDEDKRVRAVLEKADHASVIPVAKEEFDHGGTRRQGAMRSQADYMLFMTQDAVPVDDRLIEILYGCFSSDRGIAVAYGRQLPDESVGVIERYTRSFNYPETSCVKDKGDLKRMGIKTYFCSNVCAMYRRDLYEELGGFVPRTIFNEDMIFASSVIGAGYKIAYAAQAEVVHAHKYSCRQQLSRNFDLGVSQRQYRGIFEAMKSESEGMRLVKDTIKYLLKRGKWYLIPELVIQSACKLIGYKLGLRYEKLPAGIVKRLSMNKAYFKKGEDA